MTFPIIRLLHNKSATSYADPLQTLRLVLEFVQGRGCIFFPLDKLWPIPHWQLSLENLSSQSLNLDFGFVWLPPALHSPPHTLCFLYYNSVYAFCIYKQNPHFLCNCDRNYNCGSVRLYWFSPSPLIFYNPVCQWRKPWGVPKRCHFP